MKLPLLLTAVGLVACQAADNHVSLTLPQALHRAALSNRVGALTARLTIEGGGQERFLTATPVSVGGESFELEFAGVPPGTYTFSVLISGDVLRPDDRGAMQTAATGLLLLRYRQTNVTLAAGSNNDIQPAGRHFRRWPEMTDTSAT